MAAAKKDAAKAAAPEPAPAAQPKKKSKLIPITVAVLVLASGGGGGAYWYLNRQAATHEAKAEPEKPPVFQPLDNFTVNLQLEDSPQFLQTGITLKVADTAAADEIKLRMPEVRNAVLLLLSGRKASEVLSVEGKRKLGVDIVNAINAIFDPTLAASLKAITPPPPQAAPVVNAPAADAATAAPAAPATPATAPAPAPATPQAPPAAEQAAAAEQPAGTKADALVLGVLFTSFIIQ